MSLLYLLVCVSIIIVLLLEASYWWRPIVASIEMRIIERRERICSAFYFHSGEIFVIGLFLTGYLATAWLTFSLTPLIQYCLLSHSFIKYFAYCFLLLLIAGGVLFSTLLYFSSKAYIRRGLLEKELQWN